MKKWVLLIALSSILIRILFFRCPIGGDEGEYAHQAYFWLRGLSPYKSHFFFMFPGYPLVYAFALKVFGTTPLSFRLLLAFWNALVLIFIYLFGKRLVDEKVGIVSSLLYGAYSWLPLIKGNIGKEIYILLPISISLYLYLFYRETLNLFFLFLCGISFGCSVIFRQSVAPVCLLFLIFILFYEKRGIKDLVIFSLGVGFPIVISFAYGIYCVGLKKFIYYIFTYRAKTASIFVGPIWFHILRAARSLFKSGLIFWFFALFLNLRFIDKASFPSLFLFTYMIFAFFSIAINGSWYANYWAMFLPSLCVLLAWEGLNIIKRRDKMLLFTNLSLLISPFLVYAVLGLHYGSFCMRFRPQYFLTPRVANFIEKNSDESDRIYAFLYENAGIYFLSKRRIGISAPACWRQQLYCPKHIKNFIDYIDSPKRPRYVITYTETESIRLAKKLCRIEKGFISKIKDAVVKNDIPFCKDYPVQLSLIRKAFLAIKKHYVKVKTFLWDGQKVIVWERIR